MTVVNKAIEYFKYRVAHDTFRQPVTDYALEALYALEKQKPMLVCHGRTFWTYRHYCPSCSEQLRMEALKYCNNCGQKLDWSNYELGLKYAR